MSLLYEKMNTKSAASYFKVSDMKEWKDNYNWFQKPFIEWLKEKMEYEEEFKRELKENYDDWIGNDIDYDRYAR